MNDKLTYPEAHKALIADCKKGDNSAYKRVYEIYNKAMFNICMRMLNERAEAEDVLQESFLSAFKKLDQYDFKASFGSWLKRIVINKCIDALRKRNAFLVPLGELDLPEEPEQEEPELLFDVSSLKEGIAQLPDGYRAILTLYLFEDFSHKMISEKLGISEGTSKSQYSRAKARLVEWIILKKKQS